MVEQSDGDRVITLSRDDREILQDTANHVKRQLRKLESYKQVFESAREVRLTLVGGAVSLEVRGKTVVVNGDTACWRDPPGTCEPGPCPEDILRA
jgi:putative NADH-flavin reductase